MGSPPPPWSGLDGVPPPPIGTGWGHTPTPAYWEWMGYSPIKTGLGYPPPRREIGRQSSCAAGGMPLAFTQEDFLVKNNLNVFSQLKFGPLFRI